MSTSSSKDSLRSIVISYDEYQRLKNIESRFEELQDEKNNTKSPERKTIFIKLGSILPQ